MELRLLDLPYLTKVNKSLHIRLFYNLNAAIALSEVETGDTAYQ